MLKVTLSRYEGFPKSSRTVVYPGKAKQFFVAGMRPRAIAINGDINTLEQLHWVQTLIGTTHITKKENP